MAEFDAALTAKDEEITSLREQLSHMHSRSPSRSHSPARSSTAHESNGEDDPVAPVKPARQRRGKAPPVDAFTWESPEVSLEDWLPALQRAAEWNGWTLEDRLIQLAGHLRGRALQEWNLLTDDERGMYATAIEALRRRQEARSWQLKTSGILLKERERA